MFPGERMAFIRPQSARRLSHFLAGTACILVAMTTMAGTGVEHSTCEAVFADAPKPSGVVIAVDFRRARPADQTSLQTAELSREERKAYTALANLLDLIETQQLDSFTQSQLWRIYAKWSAAHDVISSIRPTSSSLEQAQILEMYRKVEQHLHESQLFKAALAHGFSLEPSGRQMMPDQVPDEIVFNVRQRSRALTKIATSIEVPKYRILLFQSRRFLLMSSMLMLEADLQQLTTYLESNARRLDTNRVDLFELEPYFQIIDAVIHSETITRGLAFLEQSRKPGYSEVGTKTRASLNRTASVISLLSGHPQRRLTVIRSLNTRE
jgi:hypothetical protein